MRDEMNEVHDWREVDRKLCGLAKERAALDAEEARWLRVGERMQLWREVGCISMLDYMEKRLGYGPRAAQERLRVACALDQLPVLAKTLEEGELPFTAVRELSRVATPETVKVWLAAGRDKSVHEIEALVSGHKPGDLPSDAPDPALVRRVLRFEVTPATYARMREAQAALADERGHRLSDDELIDAVAGAVLDKPTERDHAGRARYQIAVALCPRCDRGQQQGAGAQLAMTTAEVEQARCDAQNIGSLDTDEPTRATQDVAPRVRRFVHRRDGSTCSLPGCRSSRNLELHHIVARADDGTHDPKNLILLCDGHHAALHRGLITITGEAPDRLVVNHRHDPRAHVGAKSKLDHVTMRASVRDALVKLGVPMNEASRAVDAAGARLGWPIAFDTWLPEARSATPS